MTAVRQPPAQRVLRAIGALLVLAGIVVVLFTSVFPWVERQLADPTIDGLEERAPDDVGDDGAEPIVELPGDG